MSGLDLSPIKPKAASAEPAGPVARKLTLINARFDGLIVKTENLESSPLTSDSQITSLYVEFEILCKDQNGVLLKFKGTALIQKGEIKKVLQQGVDKRILLAKKLKALLQRIKDKSKRADSAKKLVEAVVSTKKLIDEADLKGGVEIGKLADELRGEYGDLLGADISNKLAAISTKNSGLPAGSEAESEEAFAFLDMMGKYDLGKVVWKVIEENQKEMAEIDRQAGKRKQEEKLAEKRADEKKEDEKALNRKVKTKKVEMNLAVTAARDKKETAASYYDRLDAEIQENLREFDLKKQNKKALV